MDNHQITFPNVALKLVLTNFVCLITVTHNHNEEPHHMLMEQL